MKNNGNKKLLGTYILNAIESASDIEFAKTLSDIVLYVNKNYGASVSERTVIRHIKALKDSGYEIETTIDKDDPTLKKHYYIEKRNQMFSDAEIRYIVDSILFSKHISKKMAKAIIGRFKKLYGESFIDSLKYVNSFNNEKITFDSYRFFENIDIINDAIKEKKKIRYKYLIYNYADKKPHPLRNIYDGSDAIYTVIPCATIVSGDVYHLIGYEPKYKVKDAMHNNNLVEYAKKQNAFDDGDLITLRIDHMEDIIIDEKFTADEKKKFDLFDVEKYVSEHPIISYGKVIDCEFEYQSNEIIDVYDTFGLDVKITNKKNDNRYLKVKVKATTSTLKQWFGGHLEYIRNAKTKDGKFEKEFNNMLKNYINYGGNNK